MRITTIILFTILIIGGVYVDNCQRKQTDNLAGQLRSNVFRHEQRGLLSRPTTESTGRNRKYNGKRDSVRSVRLNGSSSNSNRTITFIVTAYTKNDRGMNGRGITASGKVARHMTTVASRGLKIGTRIYLPSLNRIVVVEDKFGVHKAGNRLDLYFGGKNARSKAIKFGKRKIKGVILK